MTVFKLGQKRLRRQESDPRGLGLRGEVAGIQRHDEFSVCRQGRRENGLIVRIAELTARRYRPVVSNVQHIRQQMDQVVDALAVDWALDATADAVLDSDAY